MLTISTKPPEPYSADDLVGRIRRAFNKLRIEEGVVRSADEFSFLEFHEVVGRSPRALVTVHPFSSLGNYGFADRLFRCWDMHVMSPSITFKHDLEALGGQGKLFLRWIGETESLRNGAVQGLENFEEVVKNHLRYGTTHPDIPAVVCFADQEATGKFVPFFERTEDLYAASLATKKTPKGLKLGKLLQGLVGSLVILLSVGTYVSRLSQGEDTAQATKEFADEMMLSALPIPALVAVEGTKWMFG